MVYSFPFHLCVAALIFCLVCLDLSVGIPNKYSRGDEDPPTCGRQERKDPFPGKCGQRKGSFGRRRREGLHSGDIVGGRGASRGEFPWFVDMDDCGATIINNVTLITAAHCFDASDRKGQIVIAGSVHPMKEVMKSFDASVYCGVQIRRILDVGIPPDYCSQAKANLGSCPFHQKDVAIVTLNRPFFFDAFVQQICLPDKEWNLEPGTSLAVVGNGYVNYDTSATTNVLQTVEVPFISLETCKEWLRGYTVTEDMLCAGFEKGGKDACVGDSGGPLFLPGKTNRRRRDVGANSTSTADSDTATTLIGVVSWGINCAKANTPGVYARVDVSLPWIQSQVTIQTHKLRQQLARKREKQDEEEAADNSSSILTLGRFCMVSVIMVVCWL